MSIARPNSSVPPLTLDELIEYTEGTIKKQTATIEKLTAESHEVADAEKSLSQTIRNLAALKSKGKRNATQTD